MEKQKKRMTRSIIIVSIMVLVMVVGVAYAQTGLLIDHFDAETQNLAVNSSGPTSANSVGGDTEATILGGERDATLDFVSGSGAISVDSRPNTAAPTPSVTRMALTRPPTNPLA